MEEPEVTEIENEEPLIVGDDEGSLPPKMELPEPVEVPELEETEE